MADAVDGGRRRGLQVRGRALGRDGKGLANRVPGHITDVLAQHEAEDALRLMADAFGSTRDAVALFDARRPAARRAAGALGQRPVPRSVALGSGDTAVRSAAQVLQAALADRFPLGSHALCITPALGAVLAPQLAVKPLPKQLLQPGLASQWRRACRRHGIAPRMRALQRTESALVHNRAAIKPLLYRLRGHGFSLAADAGRRLAATVAGRR